MFRWIFLSILSLQSAGWCAPPPESAVKRLDNRAKGRQLLAQAEAIRLLSSAQATLDDLRGQRVKTQTELDDLVKKSRISPYRDGADIEVVQKELQLASLDERITSTIEDALLIPHLALLDKPTNTSQEQLYSKAVGKLVISSLIGGSFSLQWLAVFGSSAPSVEVLIGLASLTSVGLGVSGIFDLIKRHRGARKRKYIEQAQELLFRRLAEHRQALAARCQPALTGTGVYAGIEAEHDYDDNAVAPGNQTRRKLAL